MWTAILGLASSALALLAKMWGSKADADQQKVGAELANEAALRSGLSSIKTANVAAKAVNPAQEAIDADPNNLDARP